MISGGKTIKSLDSIREIVNPCLQQLDPSFKKGVKTAIDEYCASEGIAKSPDLRPNTSSRARAFGSAENYTLASSPVTRLANLIMAMPVEKAGLLLAGAVKTGFTNEGGKND